RRPIWVSVTPQRPKPGQETDKMAPVAVRGGSVAMWQTLLVANTLGEDSEGWRRAELTRNSAYATLPRKLAKRQAPPVDALTHFLSNSFFPLAPNFHFRVIFPPFGMTILRTDSSSRPAARELPVNNPSIARIQTAQRIISKQGTHMRSGLFSSLKALLADRRSGRSSAPPPPPPAPSAHLPLPSAPRRV